MTVRLEPEQRTAPLGAHGLSFLVEVANGNGEAAALFDSGKWQYNRCQEACSW